MDENNSSLKFSGFSGILLASFLVFVVIVSMVATYGFFADYLFAFVPRYMFGVEVDLRYRAAIMGGIGITLVDGGSLIWLMIAKLHARSEGQITIARQMAIAGIAVAAVMSIVQLLLTGFQMRGDGAIRPFVTNGGVVIVTFYIVALFVAVWWYQQKDPDHEVAMEKSKAEAKQRGLIVSQIRQLSAAVTADLQDALNEARPQLVQEAKELVMPQVRQQIANVIGGQLTTQRVPVMQATGHPAHVEVKEVETKQIESGDFAVQDENIAVQSDENFS